MNSSLDLHPDPGIAGYPSFDLDDPALDPAIAEAAMTSGGYPYADKLNRKAYMNALEALQIELVKLLAWIRDSEERVVVLFEGRDAAGKGGTINAFRANLNPRHARVVALSKPTDRERGEWYFQRYVEHQPTRGEIVLFDRSWYNRGVVEPVMGFSTREEAELFLKEVPQFEGMLVRDGVRLFKLWLNVGREMQLKRFHDRRHSRLKIWKLSPVDIAGLDRWDDYTKARNRMIEASHSWHAPWTIVRSNDKRRARLNAIRHVLRSLPYDDKDEAAIGAVDDSLLGFGPEFLQGIE